MSSHHVWHTIRLGSDGSWQPWGDVEGSVGDLGVVGEIGLGDLDGNLHFLATAEGTLWHSIRFGAAGNWQPWGNVEATAAGNPGSLHWAAASHLDADLHVPVLTWSDQMAGTSKVWHTIRFSANGNWQPFGEVTATAAGNPSAQSRYGTLGCAQVGTDLHVVVTGAGANGVGTIFHTIRITADGSWQPFGNVNQQIQGAAFSRVACAEVGGDLHVVATDPDGTLWHTIRFSADGSWQPVGNASAAAGDPNARFDLVACANVGGDLHVVGATTGGQIMHTIRFSQAQNWQPLGNLTAVIGAPPSEADERLAALACAGIAGDLHVSCATAPLIT